MKAKGKLFIIERCFCPTEIEINNSIELTKKVPSVDQRLIFSDQQLSYLVLKHFFCLVVTCQELITKIIKYNYIEIELK